MARGSARQQLEIQLARDLVRALVACKDVPSQELAAAIVEAMHQERPEMLQELNRAMHEHDRAGWSLP